MEILYLTPAAVVKYELLSIDYDFTLVLYVLRSRKENLQLSAEYNKLQESYKHLEALKVQLERKELAWKSNLTDSQKQSEQALQEVRQVSGGNGDTGTHPPHVGIRGATPATSLLSQTPLLCGPRSCVCDFGFIPCTVDFIISFLLFVVTIYPIVLNLVWILPVGQF